MFVLERPRSILPILKSNRRHIYRRKSVTHDERGVRYANATSCGLRLITKRNRVYNGLIYDLRHLQLIISSRQESKKLNFDLRKSFNRKLI